MTRIKTISVMLTIGQGCITSTLNNCRMVKIIVVRQRCKTVNCDAHQQLQLQQRANLREDVYQN
jgi:hypothetical protein